MFELSRTVTGGMQVTQSEDLQKLNELPLVQHMPDETKGRVLTLLLEVSKLVTWFEDNTLLHQGWLGGDVGFILLQGDVEINKEGTNPLAVSAPALLGEMHQFNPLALRTATVLVKDNAKVLKFVWRELYAQARQRLTEVEQSMLMEGIERSVWERFNRDMLIDLALFRGIPERLKLRILLVLQWIVEPTTLADGQELFRQDDLCGGLGYVLLQGNVLLSRTNHPTQSINSPNILGVMPRFDPDLKWTATAKAQGKVELLKFSWGEYTDRLQQRLSHQEQRQVADAINATAKEHFIH
jgi:hypothetical protein